MRMMSDDEWRAFAEAGTRTGKIALTRKDGSPHVTPIWFLLDGDDLVFTTHSTSAKGRILRRDPRVCLCVDDQEPPYSFVIINGEASLSEDPGELGRWATAIGARYMGADRGEEYGARNGVPGEYLVRVRISRVTAARNITD